MEITTTTNPFATGTAPTGTVPTAFGFAMPMGGQSCLGVLVETSRSSVRATGLPFAGTDVVVRDRKDLAVQGHVALIAYVPGPLAWSPPIC